MKYTFKVIIKDKPLTVTIVPSTFQKGIQKFDVKFHGKSSPFSENETFITGLHDTKHNISLKFPELAQCFKEIENKQKQEGWSSPI